MEAIGLGEYEADRGLLLQLLTIGVLICAILSVMEAQAFP